MQKYRQQGSPASACALSYSRGRKVHIGDVVGAVAVPEHQVGRSSGPGQDVSCRAANVTRTTLTVHSTATPEKFTMPWQNRIIMSWILPAEALTTSANREASLCSVVWPHADG
jgi:hypothetical protein